MVVSLIYKRLLKGKKVTNVFTYAPLGDDEEREFFRRLGEDALSFLEHPASSGKGEEKEPELVISYQAPDGSKEELILEGPWNILDYIILKENGLYWNRTLKSGDESMDDLLAREMPAGPPDSRQSIMDRVFELVKKRRGEWFTSPEIREAYRSVYNDEIKPSTLSTYLNRLFKVGLMNRTGSRAQREYYYPGTGREISNKEAYRAIRESSNK